MEKIVSKPTSDEYRKNFDRIFSKVKYNVWYVNGESDTIEFNNVEEAAQWMTEYDKSLHKVVKLC